MTTEIRKYKKDEACKGEVTSRSKQKAYLRLDNGESAYAYRYANLLPGTKVLCSILRAANKKCSAEVVVESVLEYAV